MAQPRRIYNDPSLTATMRGSPDFVSTRPDGARAAFIVT